MQKNLEESLDQLDLRGTLLLMNILAERALSLKISEDKDNKEPFPKPKIIKTDTSVLMPTKMVM